MGMAGHALAARSRTGLRARLGVSGNAVWLRVYIRRATVVDCVCALAAAALAVEPRFDAYGDIPLAYLAFTCVLPPMALLDLVDAGGAARMDAICRELRWLSRPAAVSEELVLDEPPITWRKAITWRKVARADPQKIVRGTYAACTRIRSGLRPAVLVGRIVPSQQLITNAARAELAPGDMPLISLPSSPRLLIVGV